MKNLPSMPLPGKGGQSGAALIIVLLLLLVVTLLGLASMRGAIMQERMAANTATRGMAFQVAEAGLRQAEILARDATLTFPASGCSAGRCAMVDPPAAPAWAASGFWASGGGFQSGDAVSIGATSIRPRFVIEDFGQAATASGSSSCIDMSKPCLETSTQNVYRITSYAATPNGAEVILQTLYRR
ncbi:MAG: pilus assembly protein [Pseudoxanthomonas sp.]|nr:pilus assembly protein [Pseudoxanthomonas sp.]